MKKGTQVLVKGMLDGDNPFDNSGEATGLVTRVTQINTGDAGAPSICDITCFPAMSAPKMYNNVPVFNERDSAYALGIGLAAFTEGA